MRKILLVLLSFLLVFSFVACGSANNSTATPSDVPEVIKIALITDYQSVKDQSFNQPAHEACKAFADKGDYDYKYYKPDSDSDDDRIASLEKAINDGYNVIVTAGNKHAYAIEKTVTKYPYVKFVTIDLSQDDFSEGFIIPENLYCATYKEQQAGFMAGYAAVKSGFTKLGFIGGIDVPAVIRYGYGYIQGADFAATELNLKNIEMKYVYAGSFEQNSDISSTAYKWYEDGTEVIFSCGGPIYNSVAEAAASLKGKVIGVDVDEKLAIDGTYGSGITFTSAMKAISYTVTEQLGKISANKFEGGKVDVLGVVSSNPDENYVLLPADSTQFNDKFAKKDYENLVASIYSGDIKVDDDINKEVKNVSSNIKIEDLGKLISK